MAVEPPITDEAPPFDKKEVHVISSMKNGKVPGQNQDRSP